MSGTDTLVVMPTGAGKSLVYQFAALAKGGLTLVVSPLIALMKDQVDGLVEKGIAAAALHSGQSAEEQGRVFEMMNRGHLRLLYVAPERLGNGSLVRALANQSVTLLAVDEAHCVSSWGHDFRPDYLTISDARTRFGNPQTVALTATATPLVQDDIVRLLNLSNPARIVTGFNRPNLRFEVAQTPTASTRLTQLRSLLKGEVGAVIVYVSTRKDAEKVAEIIDKELKRPVAAYHAGLPDATRSRVQEAFIQRRLNIIVATNAFGMGVDRPDVRMVLHWSIPSNLESYYQEAGRAGRDGKPSRAVLLYAPRDASLRKWFIEQSVLAMPDLRNIQLQLLRRAVNGIATIEPDHLAELTGIHSVGIKSALSLLEKAGVIGSLDSGGMTGSFAVHEFASARMKDVLQKAEVYQKVRYASLERMVQYAEADTCRRRTILDHFGDTTEASAEHCCDFCDESAPVAAPENLPAFESLPFSTRIALGLIDACRRLPFQVGRKTLVGILTGSEAKGMDRPTYRNSPYYGRLKEYRAKDVDQAYQELIGAGYLRIEGGDRPVIRLTTKGERAYSHREVIPLDFREKRTEIRTESGRIASVNPELLDALKEWRTEEARRRRLKPFMIFHDSVLAAIADERPATYADLLAISGVGDQKLELYGDAVLEIVRESQG